MRQNFITIIPEEETIHNFALTVKRELYVLVREFRRYNHGYNYEKFLSVDVFYNTNPVPYNYIVRSYSDANIVYKTISNASELSIAKVVIKHPFANI